VRHLPTLAFLGLAATLAFAAHAGGPSRGGGGGTLLGKPAIGVFPAAPAAIAPSFRSPTLPRTRVFGPRPVAGFGVPVYVGPPAYYEPPVQAPPVVYVVPAAPPAPAEPPPPPQREVVEHADGRYELRGDGIGVPHRWVWVPNPPAAPPTAAAKPDVRLYGWTDEHGVLHVTDRLDRIPERHREQAKRNASS
jgi:hypothetical protein